MSEGAGAPATDDARAPRVLSLDVLRGLDMLPIVGGREAVQAAAAATGSPLLAATAEQMQHAAWNGFTAWDLVFPLFLFLAGASLPFSLASRRARGDSEAALVRHALVRGVVLVLLGVVYNGLLTLDFATLRYASVLGRIGLAWTLAALIVLRTGWRGQAVACVAILLATWAALTLVPVPGYGAGDLSPGRSLFDWFDQRGLPGRLHRGDRDPEGLLATIPAAATALLGALAGARLRAAPRATRTSLELAGAGVVLLGLGWAWDALLPVNKHLWTSSFVCVAGGWSLLLLGVVHQLADVWALRRTLHPFAVVGRNAIAAYLLHRFVAFDAIAALLVVEGRLHPVLQAATALALLWLLLAAMHRRRLFLRV